MSARPLPGPEAWSLDPRLAYLNHGGFGATPRQVQQVQARWIADLEANPTDFFLRRLPGLLEGVRVAVAELVNADPAGVVFVGNATSGMQTVLAQMNLEPGDEIVTTDHIYPAVLAQLQAAARRSGASLRIVAIPLPVHHSEQLVAPIEAALGSATRLLVVDHVAAPSGVVFPVRRIAAAARSRGISVAVDGAHATGMLAVDLRELEVDFWVGNLHKWVCAPKSSAVLVAGPRWRSELRPLVTSLATSRGYQPAFDWTGTRDPSPLLSVPAALEFFAEPGWSAVRQANNALAARGATIIAESCGLALATSGVLSAAMRLIELPYPLTEASARAVEANLLTEHSVVVPITFHHGWRWVRVCAQLYNSEADFQRLAVALPKALAVAGVAE